MTESVVVVNEPDPDPEPDTTVVVEAPESNDESAAAVADAVGEAVAETVAAIEAHDTVTEIAEDERIRALDEKLNTVISRLDEQSVAAAVEPEPEILIEDDEIVPVHRHPWFRGLSEWRGDS